MEREYNCILHIGAPKCGSSSLQQKLSLQPDFSSDDGADSYRYVVITAEGQLLKGSKLTREASAGSSQYQASLPAGELHLIGRSTKALRNKLEAVMAKGAIPILSSESWTYAARYFQKHNLLSELGLRPRLVLFIRPPLDWINAAWWQWGAWSGQPFDKWRLQRANGMAWDIHLSRWSEAEEVQQIDVELATGDVVRSFGRLINCDWPPTERSNLSSSSLLLRYLQENPELRPIHSPGIEFEVNRWVEWPSARPPWILHVKAQEEMMSVFRVRLKKLFGFLSTETREAIESDPRWWSTKPYADIPVEAEIQKMTEVQKDELIRYLIEGLKKADQENRKLKGRS